MVVGLRFIKQTKIIYFRRECWLEWYRKGTATNKQIKLDQRNTYDCAKKGAYSVVDHA